MVKQGVKMETLQNSKTAWRDAIQGEGGYCPCCDRWGKVYPRHFNASMARALIWLVGKDETWTDVPNTAPKWLTRTNQLPTLRWWGLIVRRESDDAKVRHSGIWQPTPRGIDFARGLVSIPTTVYTYNAEVVRFGEKDMWIGDAFETHFDYAKVMLPVQGSSQMELGLTHED